MYTLSRAGGGGDNFARARGFSRALARKFNDRAILKKLPRFLEPDGSEGAADVLHNCNKVENRVACPEYARNSREADPGRDSRRDIPVRPSLSRFFCPSRGTGSRAEIFGRGGPPISGYYSIAPSSKIGFAARSVTFRGLPGEY